MGFTGTEQPPSSGHSSEAGNSFRRTEEVHEKNELKHNLKEEAIKLYETKEAEFPEPEQIREIERVVLLKVIDNKWMAHLDDMDALREGIGLQAYGQRIRWLNIRCRVTRCTSP